MSKLLLIVFLATISPVFALGQVFPFEGTWEWAQTEYSSGEIETPASVGHSEQYFFGPEQAFAHFIDEQVVAEGLWSPGEMVIGPCMVETLSVASENWVWTIQGGGEDLYLYLQTGFECPIGGGTPVLKIETFVTRGTVSADAKSWGFVKSIYR